MIGTITRVLEKATIYDERGCAIPKRIIIEIVIRDDRLFEPLRVQMCDGIPDSITAASIAEQVFVLITDWDNVNTLPKGVLLNQDQHQEVPDKFRKDLVEAENARIEKHIRDWRAANRGPRSHSPQRFGFGGRSSGRGK